ncbi:hypothetical protein MKW92_006443 [Papaver armeniacum]|nr:hypothetical protein MKW92_006443 [Papaver armeniacum]
MDTKLISSGVQYSSLPENYIRPESERPNVSKVIICTDIPIIDLCCTNRTQLVHRIGEACRVFGFFQVINHGISGESVEKMIKIAREFFKLPLDEKLKYYSDDPTKTMRLSTSFNVKKETSTWFQTTEAISESLDLQGDYIEKMLGDQEQHMAINYYPPCPQPDLTYDGEVSGQVFKDEKWMAVNPHPGAFVINIGDQLQALSNGRYKSVWHRGNSGKERISVASFLCPANCATICSCKPKSGSSAVYRNFTYQEYYKSLEQES